MLKYKIQFYIVLFVYLIFNFDKINNHNYYGNSSVKNNDPINLVYEPFSKLTPDLTEYIWPTDASYKITSSFAEYRPTHFHGGIDISTHLKEGFKVFASRSGYVARIQILPNGYGKMLYLRHNDGYYTTYAHLKDFSSKIKTVLYKEQIKRASYFVDVWLDSSVLPVEKNEFIAYTGGTGAGPPHLHFEILDENLNPVNPALFTNLKINDSTPPLIKKLYIAPAGEYSSVFGKEEYYFINIQSNAQNYKISKPIIVKGKIKLGIETKDFGNEYSSRTGVYKIKLFLNDSLIYQLQYDRIPSEFSDQILLHYDLNLIKKRKGKFQKLYVEHGNNLPIYNRFPYGSGIIDCSKLSNHTNTFKIVISDFSQNESTISGTLIVDNSPSIQLLSISDSLIKLECENIEKLESIIIEIKNETKKNIKKLEFKKRDFKILDSILVIHLQTRKNDYIKIWGVNNERKTTIPIIYKPVNKTGNFSIHHEIYKNKIKCILKTKQPILSNINVILAEGSKVREIALKKTKDNEYIGYIEPNPQYKGHREIKAINLNDNQIIGTTGKFFIYPLVANKADSFNIDSGKIIINYDKNSIFEDFIITIDSVEENGIKIYKFNPQDVPLKKGIEILVRSGSESDRIYFAKNGKWIIQNWNGGIESNYLKAKFSSTLTDVALLRDTSPPFIGLLNIKKTRKTSFISLKFKDDLSGIDYNKIKFYINNEFVIPEIDEEKKTLKYQLVEQSIKNLYSLEVEIYDKAGNIGKYFKKF